MASASVVPRLIRFSGAINPQIAQNERESGKNQLPTVVGVTFSLYELQEGGSPLWSESQKVRLDEQGRYAVLLGATQPEGLPLDLFTSGRALWLGVQPQLPGAAEQLRVLLVAVPYALKASDSDTLGGKPASAYALAGSQMLVAPATGTDTSSAAPAGNQAANGTATMPQPAGACNPVTSDGMATTNTVAKFTSACNIENSLIRDNGTGVAVGGTSTPGALLDVQFTSTATSGGLLGQRVLTTLNPAADSSASTVGAFSNVVTMSGNPHNITGNTYAQDFELDHYGTGTIKEGVGVVGNVVNRAAGTIASAYGVLATMTNASTGTITNGYGMFVTAPTNTGGGTFSNYYGLYIGNPTAAVPGAFGLYSAGGTNYFNGNVGIGTTTPAAKLEVNGTVQFDGAVTFAGGGAETLTGDLALPQTTGAGVGVIDLGGSPFIQACCPKSTQNTFVGANAGNFTADASMSNGGVGQNTAVGSGALQALTSGTFNTASGYQALYANTAGLLNTASGYQALYSNTTGGLNTASGGFALGSNTTGGSNTASGVDTLASNTSGSSNTAIGAFALLTNTTGGDNTALGSGALFQNTTGSNNTASGFRSLIANTTGYGNTASGVDALNSNTTGSFNTASGLDALSSNVGGIDNTASGVSALAANTSGGFNTANGVSALLSNTTGSGNTASGVSALAANTTGGNNTANGYQALYSNTTAAGNTASGYGALYSDTTGYGNTATGYQALYVNTTGSGNTAVGYEAGWDAASGIPTTGFSNTFVGGLATATVDGISNATAIGYEAKVSRSNSVVLGGTGGYPVNVGIGVTAPVDALDINNTFGNNILVGFQHGVSLFRVDQTGQVFADGGYQASGADFAESVEVRGNRSEYEPGDLLVIDPSGERRLVLARTPYSTLVAGIYSTKPGVLATPHSMDDPAVKTSEVPLAVMGIVPCKVTVENGPIRVGDLLVTSSRAGYAMRGKDRRRMLGAVVGKALEPLKQGTGLIQVLVTLQ